MIWHAENNYAWVMVSSDDGSNAYPQSHGVATKENHLDRPLEWRGTGIAWFPGYVKKHFADPADLVLKPEHGKISAYYNLDNGTGKVREDEDRCYFSLARDNLVNSEPLNIFDNLLSLVFFHSGICVSETIRQKFLDFKSS